MQNLFFVIVFIDFLVRLKENRLIDNRPCVLIYNLLNLQSDYTHILCTYYIVQIKTAFRVVLAEGLTCSHSEHRS